MANNDGNVNIVRKQGGDFLVVEVGGTLEIAGTLLIDVGATVTNLGTLGGNITIANGQTLTLAAGSLLSGTAGGTIQLKLDSATSLIEVANNGGTGITVHTGGIVDIEGGGKLRVFNLGVIDVLTGGIMKANGTQAGAIAAVTDQGSPSANFIDVTTGGVSDMTKVNSNFALANSKLTAIENALRGVGIIP